MQIKNLIQIVSIVIVLILFVLFLLIMRKINKERKIFILFSKQNNENSPKTNPSKNIFVIFKMVFFMGLPKERIKWYFWIDFIIISSFWIIFFPIIYVLTLLFQKLLNL